MANFAPPWQGDFESLAKQYWNFWGDALRQGAMGNAPPPVSAPGWQQAVDWWSQLLPGGSVQVNDTVERFSRQARDWFGQMQQVAAQFAGRDQNPADIAQAWRQALGAHGGANPFADIFRAMQGNGQHGVEGWIEQAKPYLDAMQHQGARWLHLPTFGPAREHQERWQKLAQAQQECQHQQNEYNALMMKAAQRAFEMFEEQLTARAEPGRQLDSARALFDLWIDVAEQAYAEAALSPEFRKVYGALTNAQMRLRLAVQREVEQVCGLFGMPTRTEVDSAHRKIAELERALRRVSTSQAKPVASRGVQAAPVRQSKPAEAATPVAASAEPDASRRLAAKRAAVATKKQGAPGKAAKATKKKAATKKATRNAPAAKKPAMKRTAAKKTTAQAAATAPLAERSTKAGSTKASPTRARSTKARSTKARPTKQATKTAAKMAPSQTAPASSAVVSMKEWVGRNTKTNGKADMSRAVAKSKSKRSSRK
ncbi:MULTISPECIES: class III poly(R)-hydroxyalkanoic acid synthase subunit PhaE [unclassified Pseudoxanthomonas]|uniref:class III poly(R)-hydroxyalkanoic acid synthase subunit PhaE n=1 Tax=unclassified Pseudoxanthomonas TaxID=2645906 RepID=UPI003076C53E